MADEAMDIFIFLGSPGDADEYTALVGRPGNAPHGPSAPG